MANCHFSQNVYSSDSDDEEEAPPKANKFKRPHTNNVKKEFKFIGLEEGEISSDDLDDDEDDGLDDNLIGGEDDKMKLEKMSEKEREEELFKRAERRDAIQARRAVKQKLKEKRDKERAEKAAGLTRSAEPSMKAKKSAYADVFSSDSEEGARSDSSGGAGPRGLRRRKVALEKRKEEHSNKFHELIQQRRQQAAKKRRFHSDEDDATDSGRHAHEHSGSSVESVSNNSRLKSRRRTDDSQSKRHGQSMSQRVFSSDDVSDSSDSSQPGGAHMQQQRRASFSSLSCSQRSASTSSNDDHHRGRSRSPVEELVATFEQLSKIRLSRFKMEKWVHMPFFDELVRGCFVRLNIGINQGVPVYRCAEIVNVVETQKIYDLGGTRTNKGIVVRIGKDQSTLRLAFVSNSNFTQEEFDSWLRRVTEANMRPPTLAFVDRKAVEIQDTINRPIRDERVVNQIIQSKRRFQKTPTNFAMRKAELMKLREIAEAENDGEQLRLLDSQLEELESQAERIERRRTLGFKSITSINQRNRALSVQQAEEAIRKESEEAQRCTEDDPYTRVHSQPVIVTKKYLEQLRQKRNELSKSGLADSSTASADANSEVLYHSQSMRDLHPATPTTVPRNASSLLSLCTPLAASLVADGDVDGVLSGHLSVPHESLHAIHNFEINIDLEMDGGAVADSQLQHQQPQPQQQLQTKRLEYSTPRSARPVHSPAAVAVLSAMDAVDAGSPHQIVGAGATSTAGSANRPSRWLLKLQEHKKKHNLI